MKVKKIETNFNRKMFLHEEEYKPKWRNNKEKGLIKIYPDIKYQDILGFGGAFTEASGYSLTNTNGDIYNKIINEYFSIDGLNYSFCRTHVGSCDFCLNSYSYLKKNDINTFSIERDKKWIIPMIKKALEVKNNIKILASPWSPPAFMKNTRMLILGGELLKKYYDLYAKYLAQYIIEYKKENINIEYISIQNEAEAIQLWESCLYKVENEMEFANNYLKPQFQKDKLNTKILVWDHNKQSLFSRFDASMKLDKNSIDGIACHWYSGDYFEEIKLVKEKYPDKLIIHTEGCTGYSNYREEDEIMNGEIYGHDIIGDLNAGVNGFIDWNMVLNFDGGPNHKKNYCNSPIMINKENNGYIKNLTFYYIGQFSKYIKQGARRIGFSKFTDKIEVTSFLNPDNSIVIVLMNRNNENIEYNLSIHDKNFHDNLDKHCIVTFIIENE